MTTPTPEQIQTAEQMAEKVARTLAITLSRIHYDKFLKPEEGESIEVLWIAQIKKSILTELNLATLIAERDEAVQKNDFHRKQEVYWQEQYEKLQAELAQYKAFWNDKKHDELVALKDKLLIENGELKKDKERLDWLEQGNHYMVYSGANIGTTPSFELLINKRYRAFNSLRTAIDQAMKGK